jgi:hypothetical protein
LKKCQEKRDTQTGENKVKKMKKLKKLSLENEMKKEAEQIEKKVRKDRSLDDVTVSDEMEKELFNKIQDYEYDKRHKKVIRKKKKSKLVIGALAAVLILVCGSVMTSVGSKSYWKVLWERDNGDENSNIINVEDMETKESEDIDELEVDKEITKVMGASLVKMQYKPEDMVLQRYMIDEDQRMAVLFYKYGDETIRYYMYTNSKDSSLGEKSVDDLIDEYEITTNGHNILVKEYSIKGSEQRRYTADFEYNDIQYQIKGKLKKEELDEILKNLFFM